MHDPEILIMDEPTRGLDPLYQNVFFKWLKKFNNKGCTCFISSHNLFEVEHICSRVAVIKKGEIVALEDIKTLQDKRMHLVEITFPEKFNKKDFEDPKWEIIDIVDKRVKIRIAGDINKLLKVLTNYQVEDLLIERATLEEIFLEYYK
jgi:ABC-2 type transport system ATP-binding protein